MKKRLLAILLAVVLVLSLAACSGSKGNGSSNSGASDAGSDQPDNDETDGPFAHDDEIVGEWFFIGIIIDGEAYTADEFEKELNGNGRNYYFFFESDGTASMVSVETHDVGGSGTWSKEDGNYYLNFNNEDLDMWFEGEELHIAGISNSGEPTELIYTK